MFEMPDGYRTANFASRAAGKGIAVAASGKVLALCGRVLSVLPLKLDNKR